MAFGLRLKSGRNGGSAGPPEGHGAPDDDEDPVRQGTGICLTRAMVLFSTAKVYCGWCTPRLPS